MFLMGAVKWISAIFKVVKCKEVNDFWYSTTLFLIISHGKRHYDYRTTYKPTGTYIEQ